MCYYDIYGRLLANVFGIMYQELMLSYNYCIVSNKSCLDNVIQKKLSAALHNYSIILLFTKSSFDDKNARNLQTAAHLT